MLDEPTTGLHFADTAQLLEVLNRLVEAGNAVVAQGTPEDVAKVAASHTGQYLKKVL